ncbi:MAG TPA: CRTAC1 family protein [Terriglobales bacterium]|nr:CRTAC1 family protein [Terriglobales bacterium]
MRTCSRVWIGLFVSATAFSQVAISKLPAAQPAPQSPLPQFEDIAAKAGLTVPHISSPDKKYIVESMSGGVGLIDCDNDGKLDIITVNGSTVERYRQGGDPMITLYHQNNDSNAGEVTEQGPKFTDITKSAGLTRKGWGMGIAVADYDNDGLQDIYVTGFGGNALYHNLGNCKFEDVTDKAGVAAGGFSTGAAWADYDRDGRVDLFVSRYVHVDINNLPQFGNDPRFCRFKGVLVQCGPWGLPGESDLLFHNKGDGTFEEVSKKAGVDDPHHYYGLGATWGDYDNDGWPDLYVANDAGPNFLYRNQHDGTFEDVALLGGVALSGDGLQQGSMGVDWGDYLQEGRLSMMVTNFVEQGSALYHNLGKDKGKDKNRDVGDENDFADVSVPSHVVKPTYPYVGWGTAFFDYDNDGWLDLFVANGHVYPQVDAIPGGTPYRQPMILFRNHRDGTFEDVSDTLANLPPQSRRGTAFGDINNDGNVDIVVLNVGEPPSLLMNRTTSANHRVLFKLIGTKSNKAAIGARVKVKAGPLVQISEVRGGASYLSQNDLRLHFGLGVNDKISEVDIRWPNGETETLRDVLADFIYTIVEGAGIQQRVALPGVPR